MPLDQLVIDGERGTKQLIGAVVLSTLQIDLPLADRKGRVLDHRCRHLEQAKRFVAISETGADATEIGPAHLGRVELHRLAITLQRRALLLMKIEQDRHISPSSGGLRLLQ